MHLTFTIFLFLSIFQDAISLETLPPIASCISSQRLELNEDGELTIYPKDLDSGSFCPIGELTLDMAFNPGDYYPFEDSFMDSLVITPQLVSRYLSLILRVTDPLGNSDYCIASVYVKQYSEEDTPPIAICRDYPEFELQDTPNFILRAEDIDNGSFDTEGTVSIQIGLLDYEDVFRDRFFREEFILGPEYTNQELRVLLLVTDEAQNTSSCLSTIYIHDTFNDIIPPVSLCRTNWELKTSPEYGATLSVTDIDRGSYDETSLTVDLKIARKLTNTIPSLDAFSRSVQIQAEEIGNQVEIILRVEDKSGNISYCNSIVEIVELESNFAVELAFPDTTIQLQDSLVCVPLFIENFKNIASMQWSFTWDTSLLAFHSWRMFDTSVLNITDRNYNVYENKFIVSWIQPELIGLTLNSSTFAEFCFRNNSSSPDQTTLLFTNTVSEFVNSEIEEVPVFMKSGIITISEEALEDSTTSLKAVKHYSIQIYPNPTNGSLYIVSEVKIQEVTIFDIHAKRIKAFIQPREEIDVEQLVSGIYFIQILTSEGIQTKRFTVQ